MNLKITLAGLAAAALLACSFTPASAASGVTAGTLTCNAASGWGYIVGSTTDLNCTYTNTHGQTQHYNGKITKAGVDIGYHEGGILIWGVIAPTADLGKGALSGDYVGVTAGASFGVGANGNLLVGGSNKTISLQPLSVEGATGINVAAGLAGITLTAGS
jgi:hypothetical protein